MSSSRFHLLQIFNRTIGGGGEDVAVRSVARLLAKQCELRECTFQSSDWTGLQAPPVWRQAAWTFRNPLALKQILDTHYALKADAWILHNWVPVVSAGVYGAAREAGVPIIQFVHNFRPFSVNSYLWQGRNLDIRAWRRNFAREILARSWQNSRLKTAWLAAAFATLHARKEFGVVKAWVAVSEFMRDRFIQAGCMADDVFALRHSWSQMEPAPAPRDDGHYLFLGRLIEEKGIEVLLRAWDFVVRRAGDSAPRLVICGNGPLMGRVTAVAARNPRIEYRGVVDGEIKRRLLAGCRAVIVPSIWWEPLGLVVYEAYDFARPVLAARSGGLTETVRHGETGFLHTPGASEELAEQILTLDADAGQRRQLGMAGRAWLLANTNEEEWRCRFLEIVHHALRPSPIASRKRA